MCAQSSNETHTHAKERTNIRWVVMVRLLLLLPPRFVYGVWIHSIHCACIRCLSVNVYCSLTGQANAVFFFFFFCLFFAACGCVPSSIPMCVCVCARVSLCRAPFPQCFVDLLAHCKRVRSLAHFIYSFILVSNQWMERSRIVAFIAYTHTTRIARDHRCAFESTVFSCNQSATTTC